MSTGKRLAKRSIIGTRVVAPGDDGMYYSGVIHAVKTPATYPENSNCINLTPNTRYSVRFDAKKRTGREFAAQELVGPGFRGTAGLQLALGQKVFLTFNGREVSGEVREHRIDLDEVVVVISPIGSENSIELRKRLEEVRLLESRKSPRLADQDTDFARLADMAGDRRKVTHSIDMPLPIFNPRKRRPSSSGDSDMKDDQMDECNAALVLMSLSSSPHSPRGGTLNQQHDTIAIFSEFINHAARRCRRSRPYKGRRHRTWGGSSSASPGGSSSGSWRSGTPSPPLGGSPTSWPASLSDEGIGLDYCERDEMPKKKKINHKVFKCTWPGCATTTNTRSSIVGHVRKSHLPEKSNNPEDSDHEEEFYYTECEVPPPPTLSHRDMCRPPHEDPDYQRQFVGTFRQGLLSTIQSPNYGIGSILPAGPITIPGAIQAPWANSHSPNSPQKHMKMSGAPLSPARRSRESKKCRKYYGMDRREQWCTQCKWKKACSRFGD